MPLRVNENSKRGKTCASYFDTQLKKYSDYLIQNYLQLVTWCRPKMAVYLGKDGGKSLWLTSGSKPIILPTKISSKKKSAWVVLTSLIHIFGKFRPDFIDSNLKVSQYSLFDEHNLNLALVQNTFWKKKKIPIELWKKHNGRATLSVIVSWYRLNS